ncbi:MAG: ion transporter [Magnetococcales bacterium]|nr:ion transporter [Magnetococcales bacterium]NGZ28542.1 ion transporter [Magnetococcales bacterium]
MLNTLLTLPEKAGFHRFIVGVILVNALILGILTHEELDKTTLQTLQLLDDVCLAIFCVELILKMAGNWKVFFANGWNLFDTVVVAVSLVPETTEFSVIRTLRIFRVVDTLPSMRKVITAMFTALPGTASVAGVLLVLTYVAAIIANNFFGKIDPENFGNLGTTFFTLFQFLTSEGWPDVARPVMEKAPHAWIFFIGFLLMTTLTTLSLLFGIIVQSMDKATQEESRHEIEAMGEHPKEDSDLRLIKIEKELHELHKHLGKMEEKIKLLATAAQEPYGVSKGSG